mmetsp:Transcript_27870/g.61130  ORF Transcript_27870/g.61130 Transcript_27870/m.61130 type:complete len:204 (-) Transcript_27870:1291-1902(-)
MVRGLKEVSRTLGVLKGQLANSEADAAQAARCHLSHNVEQLLAPGLSHGPAVAGWCKLRSTLGQHPLRSSLVVHLVHIASLDHTAAHLLGRGEPKHRSQVALLLLAHSPVVNAQLLEQHEQGALGAVAHKLDAPVFVQQEGLGVERDVHAQLVDQLGPELRGGGCMVIVLPAEPALHDCHAVLCEGAGLIRADGCSSAHGFAG